jgi:tetratricopeptide (TPR) repeat protein
VPAETVLGYEAVPASLSAATGVQIFTAMPADPVDDDVFGPGGDIGDLGGIGGIGDDSDDFDDLSGPPQSVLDQMEARSYELKAALRIDQRSFSEALDLLDHALALDPGRDRRGRLWLSKAAVLAELRRGEAVLAALAEAERCLDPEPPSRPALCLRLQEIDFFCQTGHYEDALVRWPETVELLDGFGSVRDRLRGRCLEGWIAAGTGRPEEALPLLEAARAELQADGQSFEAIGLALDIAALLAGRGDLSRLAEISRELEPLVRDRGLSVEARSALKTFRWAVERGRFKRELGHKMAIELRKAGCRLARPYDIPL